MLSSDFHTCAVVEHAQTQTHQKLLRLGVVLHTHTHTEHFKTWGCSSVVESSSNMYKGWGKSPECTAQEIQTEKTILVFKDVCECLS